MTQFQLMRKAVDAFKSRDTDKFRELNQQVLKSCTHRNIELYRNTLLHTELD